MQPATARGACAVAEVERAEAELVGERDPARRLEALRFLVHIVADLHQPLHAGDGFDRGGNDLRVRFGKRREPTNLHHVWDTEIPERQMEGADPAEYAATLEANFADSFARWQHSGIQLEDWAWDSHQHAVETTYGSLPKKIAVEPDVPVSTCADDNNIGDRMLHKHLVLGATYQEEAVPVVEESLAAAAIRLAMVLNEALK